jgi:hypothetical protein
LVSRQEKLAMVKALKQKKKKKPKPSPKPEAKVSKLAK